MPDGREYQRDPNTPSALEAVQTATVPVLPSSIEKLLRPNGHSAAQWPPHNGITYSPTNSREESYARTALNNVAHKIASTPPNTGRNNELNNGAITMGHMVAAGWIGRATVEGRLFDAAAICGLVKDDGQRSVLATIKSGLDAGEKEPHAPLPDREEYRGPNDADPFDESDPKFQNGNANWSHGDEQHPANGGGADIIQDLGERDAGDDVELPPPRRWLLGNQFCKKFLSGLIAPGSTGKSALRLAQCLSLATGRQLTGQHVFRRSRVLVVSLDDDGEEMKRRILAARIHHGIPLDEVKGWLFYATPKSIKLAEMRNGSRQIGMLERSLRKTIERRRPDLIVLDPYVKTHALEENDNGAMDFVCDLWQRSRLITTSPWTRRSASPARASGSTPPRGRHEFAPLVDFQWRIDGASQSAPLARWRTTGRKIPTRWPAQTAPKVHDAVILSQAAGSRAMSGHRSRDKGARTEHATVRLLQAQGRVQPT
jgi:hypothetical protein